MAAPATRALRVALRGGALRVPPDLAGAFNAGTRSEVGRDCRDAFLSLAKTCDKLGIAVWD